jgi:heme-degrading monooxygenase HmoA
MAASFEPGQVITIFRNRLRPDGLDEYGSTAAEMSALARTMAGYVDHKSFTADDGERVTVVTFADEESQTAWRRQVEHRAAQRRGREAFYAEYTLQVGICTTAHVFTSETS